VQYATPNLQTLELLDGNNFGFFRDVTEQMPYLKRLFLNLMSTTHLVKLFQIMINLEELNLSVYSYAEMEVIKIPTTLEKLHLEIDCSQLQSEYNKKSVHQPSYEMLNKLLDNFRTHLKYLSLFVVNAEEEFSNFTKFHSLVNNFQRLETFEYDIRTIHKPDQRFLHAEELVSFESTYSAHSNPQPRSFDRTFRRVKAHKFDITSNLTRSQLLMATKLCVDSFLSDANLPTSFELSDNLQLGNLSKIKICQWTVDSAPEICPFLSKIIALSPNLRSLVLEGEKIEDILLLLKRFITSANISRKIAEIEVIVYNYSNESELTLCCAVAQILPNLKLLMLSLNSNLTATNSNRLKKLIKCIRADFRKLNNLTFVIRAEQDNDDHVNMKIKSYKKSLNELRHEMGVPFYWSTDVNMGDDMYFIIWM
jgi:hypothetical protein